MPRKKKATRQANGTGSKVIELSPTCYRIDVSLGLKPDGKRDRRSVYGTTEDEARQAARGLQLRHGRGLTTQTSTVTFGEWFLLWLEGRKPFLEVASVELYTTYQRLYLPEKLKTTRLQALRVTDFKDLDTHLLTTALTRQTRAKVMGMCRQSLREAVVREFIVTNPAEAVKVQATKADEERRSNAVNKALTDDEMDRFLDAAHGDELYPLFYTMFSLGLRVGEALGLRWEDLDFQNRKAHLIQQVKLAAGKWVTGRLKTRGSRRVLPMSEDLAAVLEAHRWRQDEIKGILGEGWTELGFVFASAVGTALDKNNINKKITKLRLKTNVKPFSSHTCRHTRLTALLRDGVDPEVVAAFAGHSNSTITRTIYRTVFEVELPTVSLEARRNDRTAKAKAEAKKAKRSTANVPPMSQSKPKRGVAR
jgi:integrase